MLGFTSTELAKHGRSTGEELAALLRRFLATKKWLGWLVFSEQLAGFAAPFPAFPGNGPTCLKDGEKNQASPTTGEKNQASSPTATKSWLGIFSSNPGCENNAHATQFEATCTRDLLQQQ